ncbi:MULTISPECIES: response regulator [unclassified Methylobacterium]|jgi:CheY-like chemotaxis protein|uniref:response regulator n=1 Tax=unclassified Methylobacterium TaxID=2615210 RepID=UPI001FBA4681|nr:MULTISPECIES: response regulator [unclassified Methylobacterium]MCJ2088026.1 response regulator [Methylobacterium sp. E-005]MCJ2099778.1 response regulator [Methylobacterium sp. E-046]
MTEDNPTGQTLVLVVEDDPILMLSLVGYVEDAGCDAVEATSVAEAIRLLETRSDIRTVFTDLDMRGSTAGMKLALAIRDRWPPIELLMVSSQPWDAAQIPARGVVLGKPFDGRRIVAAIQRFAA